MGACYIATTGKGATAKEAFQSAVEEARYMHGNSGYSGTIAEFDGFKMMEVPEGMTVNEFVDSKMEKLEKWGPGGCVKLEEGTFLFFGWAAE